jgi:hypothetical protein
MRARACSVLIPLLETNRLTLSASGASTLTIKSVVYGFGAFSAERYPKAASIISGTGLVAPTF